MRAFRAPGQRRVLGQQAVRFQDRRVTRARAGLRQRRRFVAEPAAQPRPGRRATARFRRRDRPGPPGAAGREPRARRKPAVRSRHRRSTAVPRRVAPSSKGKSRVPRRRRQAVSDAGGSSTSSPKCSACSADRAAMAAGASSPRAVMRIVSPRRASRQLMATRLRAEAGGESVRRLAICTAQGNCAAVWTMRMAGRAWRPCGFSTRNSTEAASAPEASTIGASGRRIYPAAGGQAVPVSDGARPRPPRARRRAVRRC